MSGIVRKVLVVAAAAILFGSQAFSAELEVDDFTSAVNTAANIELLAPGSVTKTDTMLDGVLGGTREVTVTLDAGIQIKGGVQPPPMASLKYALGPISTGSTMVRYPNIGGASVAFAEGFRLSILNPDPTASSITVSLTISDGSGGAETLVQNPMVPAMQTSVIDFPKSGFPGIDFFDITEIEFFIMGGAGADLRFEPIATFGTPEMEVQDVCDNDLDDDNDGLIDCFDPDCSGVPECAAPAPTMGPVALMGAALMLVGMGAVGILRRRRSA